MSRAVRSVRSRLRPVIATRAPIAASPDAVALPMPEVAPVTITVLPAICPSCVWVVMTTPVPVTRQVESIGMRGREIPSQGAVRRGQSRRGHPALRAAGRRRTRGARALLPGRARRTRDAPHGKEPGNQPRSQQDPAEQDAAERQAGHGEPVGVLASLLRDPAQRRKQEVLATGTRVDVLTCERQRQKREDRRDGQHDSLEDPGDQVGERREHVGARQHGKCDEPDADDDDRVEEDQQHSEPRPASGSRRHQRGLPAHPSLRRRGPSPRRRRGSQVGRARRRCVRSFAG